MLEGTTGAGGVLKLVRDGRATTRNELAQQSGLSRSTLAERVQSLLALDLLEEATGVASTGGRPPATLTFNRSAGVVLVAALNALSVRVAVCDLEANPLAEHAFGFDAGAEPAAVLSEIHAELGLLLERGGIAPSRARGIGVAVQAPVAIGRGEPVDARMMPRWDGFSIPRWFAAHTDAPVLVDSHVNVMALGEHWTHWREVDHAAVRERGDDDRVRDRVRRRRSPRCPRGGGRHRAHPARRPRRRAVPVWEHRLPGGRRGRGGAGVEPVGGGATGPVGPRCRHARARGRAGRTAGDPRRRASRRRGAGGVHQLLQPGRDRRRRRARRGPAAAAGRRPRGRDRRARCRWPRATCAWARPSWAPARP